MLWKADLGSRSYGGPVVSGGKVYVGTNNENPRNKRDTKPDPCMPGKMIPIDRGVLMCFDEKTGKFLWQAVHPKLPSGQVNDWPEDRALFHAHRRRRPRLLRQQPLHGRLRRCERPGRQSNGH